MQNKYYKRKGLTFKLTEEFYKLSLLEKYFVIQEWEKEKPDLLNNESFHDAIVLALLQHSTPEDKENIPVQSVRKLHTEAKKRDEIEAWLALYNNADKLLAILERQGLVRGVFE